MKIVILVMLTLMMSGCLSLQDNYKPLYQVKPEKKAIEVDKK